MERALGAGAKRLEGALSPDEEARVRAARTDPVAFIEYVMRAPTGEKLVCEVFHREWQEHVTSHRRAYIEAPRDHGKTAQTLGRVLYEIGRNPGIRVKILCQSDSTAKKRLAVLKDYIEHSPEFQRVFPNIRKHPTRRDWGAFSFTVDRPGSFPDATVEAVGITSSGTGGRADIILADDVVDERNAITQPALRVTVKEHWHNVWINLLEPDGQVIFICTPWHADDLTQELKASPSYAVLSHVVGPDFEPVWPSKWPAEALRARAQEIGMRRFDRAFRARCYSDDELLFDRESLTRAVSRERTTADLPKALTLYMGVDLAIAQSKRAAFTVLFVAGVDDVGFRYPVHVVRRKLDAVATACWVLAMHGRYNLEQVAIENNQYQVSLLEWIEVLRKSTNDVLRSDDPPKYIMRDEWAWMRPAILHTVQNPPRLVPIHTGAQKAQEDVGLPGLATEVRSNLWRVYLGPGHGTAIGDGQCVCDWCVWLAEAAGYPAARYSDTVMAWWFVQTLLRNIGGGRVQFWFAEGADKATPRWVGPDSTMAALAMIGAGRQEVSALGTCSDCRHRNEARANLCGVHGWHVQPRQPGCEWRDDPPREEVA